MTGRFSADWRRYRQWRNALLAVWLGWIPGILLVAYASARFFQTPVPIYVTIVLWMAAFVVLGIRVGNWPCPRCGNRFARKSKYDRGSLFTKRCVHCGLPKYSPEP